jgi:hypothetical protein
MRLCNPDDRERYGYFREPDGRRLYLHVLPSDYQQKPVYEGLV